MKNNNSCIRRLFDTVRCNFVRLNKNFLFCPTCPNHPMKTKNNFSKVSHPVSNATMRSPSHLSPLPSHLTKLSQVCIVLKKVYRFILSISLMTGNVEPSLLVQKSVGGSMPPQTLMTVERVTAIVVALQI